MSKVGKKLLLVLIPLLVVLVGCLTLLLVLPGMSYAAFGAARQITSKGVC